MAQPIGDQLGLGSVWHPGPVSWRWAIANGPAEKLYVLVLATTSGQTGVAFTAADLQKFADGARSLVSGLQLPSAPSVALPGFLRP